MSRLLNTDARFVVRFGEGSMNIKEAIVILKEDISWLEDNMEYFDSGDRETLNKEIVAKKMAVEVMEKQAPKEAEYIKECEGFYCQGCHKRLDGMTTYCPNCGRLLEWPK